MSNDLSDAFCVLLDNWYLDQKPKLLGTTHRLGVLKEVVKEKICKHLDDLEKYVETMEIVAKQKK